MKKGISLILVLAAALGGGTLRAGDTSGAPAISALDRQIEYERELQEIFIQNNSEQLAKHLFGMIDLQQPGTRKYAWMLENGEYQRALREYHDQFIDHLASLPFIDAPIAGRWFGMEGVKELMENNIVRQWHSVHGSTTIDIGPPGQVDWFPIGGDNKGDYDNVDHLANMKWAVPLIKALEMTGESRYLERWAAYWEDLVTNHFLNWIMVMNYRDEEQYRKQATQHYNVVCQRGYVLHLAWRQEWFIYQLAQAARYDADLTKKTVTPDMLAKMLIRQIETIWPRIMNGINPATLAPNQVAHTVTTAAVTLLAFPDYQDTAEWARFMRSILVAYVNNGTILPDGSDLEQSLNYNSAPIGMFNRLKNLFPKEVPPHLKDILDLGDYIISQRRRFLTAVKSPTGRGPQLAQQGWPQDYNTPVPPEELRKSIALGINGDENAEIGFTSITFPYGGYNILRTGWSGDTHHLWMKASRAGRGHGDQSGNAIQLTAFGKTLLFSGGSGFYAEHWINGYRRSSFAHNTVVVDGQGQRLGAIHPPRRYEYPIEARWHTSDTFDFTEGFFQDAYGEIRDVQHQREIIFDRHAGLYIVTDRLRSPAEHSYTQIWTFNPDFAADEVVIDPAAQTIKTISPAGPNITLRSIAPFPLEYETFHGQKDPVRGWANTSGGVVPKVDVHANWQGVGDQLLITVLYPMKGMEDKLVEFSRVNTENTIGFEALTKDGKRIIYKAAREPDTEIATDEIEARCEALLVTTDADGRMRGLILNGRSFSVNGTPQEVTNDNYEFTVENGSLNEIRPFGIPAGFRWVETDKGAIPKYDIGPVSFMLNGQQVSGTADFSGEAEVKLAYPVPDAVIRYTTDGGPVSAESPLYETPLQIDLATTIRARAFLPKTGDLGLVTDVNLKRSLTDAASYTISTPKGETRPANTQGELSLLTTGADDFAFSTPNMESPHIDIDLGKPCVLDEIEVWNRRSCCWEQADGLTIWVSATGENGDWREVAVIPDFNRAPWQIDLDKDNTPVRYVRLGLSRTDKFHLRRVRIYGTPAINKK